MKTIQLVVLFLAALFIPGHAQSNQKLVIKGSDTLGFQLLPALVEAFHETSPAAQFQLVADGSSHGLDALLQGTTNLAISSRRALPQEYARAGARGVVLRPVMVCWDGIAIVVNEHLPVEELSLRQLRQLFTGEVRTWQELGVAGGEVHLYTRTPSSGTYLDFDIMVLNRRDYSRAIRMQLRNQQIVQAVSRDPGGIGYVGMAFAHQPGVRVLRVDGVLPGIGTVHDKSYPISRPNFFYTDGQPEGVLEDFIEFVLSPAGQSVIRAQGFVPPDPEP